MAKGKEVKMKKGGMVDYAVEFNGRYFDPLLRPQTIHGVFVGSKDVESKFRNERKGSPNEGKKTKTNYEIKTNHGSVIFSEGSGPLQALLDDLAVGDYVEIGYKTLKTPDGTPMPPTVKTKEQLWKWRGGKKEPSYPVWDYLRGPKRK